jgi:hypothetical protein
MTIIPVPDPVRAVVLRLKANGDLTAFWASGQAAISAELQATWVMPGYAILVQGAGGPPPDDDIDLFHQRVDLSFYGTDRRLARNLWAVAHRVLCPRRGSGSRSFTLGGCVVQDIYAEAAPIPTPDQDHPEWPRWVCPYVLTYQEEA